MDYKQTLMYKEINETPDALAAAAKTNADAVRAVVTDFHSRGLKHITGAARGTSFHALLYFKYLIEIFGAAQVATAACSALTVYGGSPDYSDSLVIGVSQSGKAADVLEVLRAANAKGAITVAVTNNPDSPLAREAKYHLFCACGEEKSVAATKTFAAQCFILAQLAGELAQNANLINQTASLSARLRAQSAQLESAAGELANKIKSAADGFALSRGILYPLALEASLKLQETSYIKMRGYAHSDFRHGPMAMISDGVPVLFFAGRAGFIADDAEDARFAETNEVVQKLTELGADIHIITDCDCFGGMQNVTKIDGCGYEPASFFEFAMFAQFLACRVACSLGNNPDSPRALNKVTVTK